jgi:DNA-binding NarL/FixJ family response regulator
MYLTNRRAGFDTRDEVRGSHPHQGGGLPDQARRLTATPRPGRLRVLLVEDDAETRGMLRELLEGEDIAIVGEAGNGSEAVRLAQEHAPDVVLMDVRMPVMDGIEATRIIASSHLSTRVVILSSFDDRVLRQAAADAGAYAYVVKGSSAEPILEAVLRAADPQGS